MKCSRATIHRKTHAVPELRFEDQQLTSFSGLVLLQPLLKRLQFKDRLCAALRPSDGGAIFGSPVVVLVLIVHLLLGYRELRQIRYYSDDPLVRRVLGLSRLPDVATVSRTLAKVDTASVEQTRVLLGDLVLERLTNLDLQRVTLDFDGSVIGTSRYAEGAAVGFNRKKKGQRSYYPLFCTVAQTSQVLDVLHRSGNVHDSNGARAFIEACIRRVRTALPSARIEVRMDSAFFSDAIIDMLEQTRVEYTVSVPFERFTELKGQIETRRRWSWIDTQHCAFERSWKPKNWRQRRRFVFIRKCVHVQRKEPVQLDLFVPVQHGYEFKVIVTNKHLRPRYLVPFHDGRGAQEGIFAELKTDNQLDYVPTRTWLANQLYLLSALFAHNLARELQMVATPPARSTSEKRPALWEFRKLDTLRRHLIQRAGRLIRPQGKLTLSMSTNASVQDQLLHYLNALACPV